MLCPGCGVEQPVGNNFCEDCGTSIHAAPAVPAVSGGCPQCGAPADAVDDDGFCTRCGTERVGPARDHVEQVLSPLLAGVSDRGLRHHRNEDALELASGPGGDVLIVCDGVSRSQNPDGASGVAATAACDFLRQVIQSTSNDSRAAVAAALHAAHDAVVELPVSKADKNDPPETTIVVALRRGKAVSLGWVGDSRAYLVDQRGVRQLTQDHSWVNDVVDAGRMTMAEALRAPLAHALTRTLGGPTGEDATGDEPSQLEVELPPSPGCLILCSDGLWNYLADTEHLATLIRSLADDADALNRARALIDFARDRGGHDNITAAVLNF